jgi:hypothetical protein
MRHTSDLKRGGRAGCRRGAANKHLTAFKAALLKSFQALAGVPALAKWGREHPTEFYKLCGQLLPYDPLPTGSDTPAIVIKVGTPLVEQVLGQPPDAQREIARAIGVAVASTLAELTGADIVTGEPDSSTPPSRVH